MAQWRPLHKRITSSDKAYQLADEPGALWLYCALLPHTDKEGRVNANPHHILGGILEGWPYSPETIEGWLRGLARVGLIKLYANGRRSHIAEYTKHREMAKPDKREPESELPGPDDPGSETLPPMPQEEPGGPTGQGHSETPGELREDSAKTPGNAPEEPRQGHAETPRTDVHVHMHVQGDVHNPPTPLVAAEPLAPPDVEAAPRRALGKPQNGKTKNGKARSPTFNPAAITLPEFVSPDVWRDFVDHRRRLHKVLTERAVELILADLAETPDDADEMLRRTVTNGWTGVFPLDHRRRDTQPPGASKALDQYTERGL
jgi:hypothetical protein